MAHRKNRESTLFQPIDNAVIAVYQFSYVLVVDFRYNSTAFRKDVQSLHLFKNRIYPIFCGTGIVLSDVRHYLRDPLYRKGRPEDLHFPIRFNTVKPAFLASEVETGLSLVGVLKVEMILRTGFLHNGQHVSSGAVSGRRHQ